MREVRGYEISREESGIYYVRGDIFPIQVIITCELSREENLWLCSLTGEMPDEGLTEQLVKEYETHPGDEKYESVFF